MGIDDGTWTHREGFTRPPACYAAISRSSSRRFGTHSKLGFAMNFPRWLTIIWWGLSLIGLFSFLLIRLAEVQAGNGTVTDVAVFLVFMALWVLPLVSEVEMFGVRLKTELQQLRGEVHELKNSIEIRNTLSTNVYNMPSPPSEQELPRIKEEILSVLADAMRETQFRRPSGEPSDLSVPKSAEYLFQVRYSLEKEIRRIYQSRYNDVRERFKSVISMAHMLVKSEDLSPELSGAIREVYSACSAAVHGEEISDKQVAFVREVAPELISVLRGIE